MQFTIHLEYLVRRKNYKENIQYLQCVYSKQIQKNVTSQNSFIGKQYQREGNFQILWYRNALEYLGISFVIQRKFQENTQHLQRMKTVIQRNFLVI
jgi:hypothetical protein